jgi:hypothetical protein
MNTTTRCRACFCPSDTRECDRCKDVPEGHIRCAECGDAFQQPKPGTFHCSELCHVKDHLLGLD